MFPPLALVVLLRAQCCWFKIVEVVDLYILLPQAMFLSPLRSNDRFAYGALSRGPRKFLICGESGGIERFQLA